ncbi:MAG: hypothetical protein QOD42_2842 [Sphingomonadales bacterium]|jgi:hypothetical protein|nr:hypothetical protein [Sphingomonadales bacterium]
MRNVIARYLATLQGRVGTGLLAIFAAVNFAQPGSEWSFQWERLAALLAAAGVWLVAEFQSSAAPHPHDVRLFNRIIETVGDGERSFLRFHDFHASFPRARLDGTREISLWEGASYAFLDSGLRKQWEPVRAQIDAFRDLVAVSTAPDRFQSGNQTVHPHRSDPSDPSERVREEISALNIAASSLIKSFDAFEIYGRKRLGV